MNKIYGYARVSTKEQNLERQFESLTGKGVQQSDIYFDKQSGKDFDRAQYQMLKNTLLRSGDTLVIKELDRLGRDWEAIKSEWAQLEEKGVNMVVIDQPMLDTVGKSDLERKLIHGILFDLLAYTAEKERRKIRQRQAEGLSAMPVNEAGKKVSNRTGREHGRPVLDRPVNFAEIYTGWKRKDYTALKAMDMLGLKKMTFYKMVKEYEAEVTE